MSLSPLQQNNYAMKSTIYDDVSLPVPPTFSNIANISKTHDNPSPRESSAHSSPSPISTQYSTPPLSHPLTIDSNPQTTSPNPNRHIRRPGPHQNQFRSKIPSTTIPLPPRPLSQSSRKTPRPTSPSIHRKPILQLWQCILQIP